MSVSPGSNALCQVLAEDSELAEAIPADRRAVALEECTAPMIWVPNTGWRGEPAVAIGLLVLEGLLIRRVGIDERFGAELIGQGDILRPWQHPHDSPTLALKTRWSVVQPARVALLDRDFMPCLARYPELTGALIARAVQRSMSLGVMIAIVHQARVDVRIHMLLWHLAARWGRVRSDAMALPLRLTHSVLADLVAARRPTVTSAVTDLTKRGLVRSAGDVWLLYGEPPGEWLDIAHVRTPNTST